MASTPHTNSAAGMQLMAMRAGHDCGQARRRNQLRNATTIAKLFVLVENKVGLEVTVHRVLTSSLLIGSLVGCSATSQQLFSGIGGAHTGGEGGTSGGGGAGGQGGVFFPGSGGEGMGDASDICKDFLEATVRDFSQTHPDFETFAGLTAFTGIVGDQLGSDDKPVYAHAGPTAQTTGPGEFFLWYRDVPGVNHGFTVHLPLEMVDGVSTFVSSSFFPIDGMGFGNEGHAHNYHFTTELHAVFDYKGGEVFTFSGDDDLWMFLNGKLAIDLGGLHEELSVTIDLDAVAQDLNIEVGNRYAMDIFHAERHTTESNFRIATTIECFESPGVPE